MLRTTELGASGPCPHQRARTTGVGCGAPSTARLVVRCA